MSCSLEIDGMSNKNQSQAIPRQHATRCPKQKPKKTSSHVWVLVCLGGNQPIEQSKHLFLSPIFEFTGLGGPRYGDLDLQVGFGVPRCGWHF